MKSQCIVMLRQNLLYVYMTIDFEHCSASPTSIQERGHVTG